ncbi:MAG: AAA family ATPase [Actinomycetota bacterium]|nr:AAA family ATPase [Actinomycetota bacterium]
MAVCSSCGQENPEIAKFCLACGAPLDTVRKAAAEERKVVSILFVDLVGFTARSHAADPEDVRAALGPYHALLKREIERFGGTVEKFIGDAVMAVFGAPVAHEDDAERAVRTALRITEAIAELNEDNPALDLSVRAAVNTGEGLVALGARPEAGEGFVTGDVVNTASRLQNVAPVNGVVVGEITYRSTKDFIDYQELEPVTVKGKPEPVAVWRALSARSRFGLETDLAPKTPFIGRDYEQTILKETFRRTVREASIQLVTVVGEPGVGKSRLLAEFFSFIDDQEQLVFWRQGRSLPYGEGITFWALGEIVKAHAGILESDSAEDAADKLRTAITTAVKEGSEQQWFFSRLAPLVGVEVGGGGSPQKEESFTAWRRFLEGVAEERPLVLVFEDLHWADPSLLEFIEHLVDWVSGVPVFVVCTARPELYDKHPSWGGGKRNITIVSLSPLDDSETAQLISSLLSQAVLPAEIHAALLERAGGNPLYAEEFIRMLSDRGILKQQGRVLTLEKDADIPVPESVHALIAARLDTLSGELKSLLQDASVAGKVFWSGAVAAIGQADPDRARRGLHELGAKELVRPSRSSSMEGQAEYVFWHALIRDVCYGQIPRAARATKHQAMADWIEAAAERLDDHAEVLAHHYSTALELAKASGRDDVIELETQTRRFLMTAADRALNLDASKSLSLYRKALELFGPRDPELPKALREAGRACRSLGLLSEAEDYLRQAIAECSVRRDRIGEGIALTRLAHLLHDEGRNDEGAAAALKAVDELIQESPGEELEKAYGFLAFFKWVAESLDEALAWADKALEVALACDSKRALAGALGQRGCVQCDLGDLSGVENIREALRLWETIGDVPGSFGVYNNLADFLSLIDGPRQGLELNLKAQELGRSHGYANDAIFARAGSLRMLFELGSWGEVLAQADEVIAWAQEHQARLVASTSSLWKAFTLFYLGRPKEALAMEGNYLPLLREIDEAENFVPSLSLAALMRSNQGNHLAALDMTLAFDKQTAKGPNFRARYLPDIVRVLVITGNIDRARGLLEFERDVVYPRDRHALLTARSIVAEGQGQIETALALYSDAVRRWNEFGFVLEEGQAWLGKGRCLVSMGRSSEAPIALHEARKIFIKLGAQPLIEETDSYLGQATALSS